MTHAEASGRVLGGWLFSYKRGAPVYSCGAWYLEAQRHRGTSLIRKRLFLGPYKACAQGPIVVLAVEG